MKTNIIEVGLSTARLSDVQPLLEACLRETGDMLIGRQEYDDMVLLVVRLLHDTMQYHIDMLSAALRQERVDSFQIVNCQLFKVAFRQGSIQAIMSHFPLRMGESWFPATDEENAAYICLISPQLSQEQVSWLATQTSITLWNKAS